MTRCAATRAPPAKRTTSCNSLDWKISLTSWAQRWSNWKTVMVDWWWSARWRRQQVELGGLRPRRWRPSPDGSLMSMTRCKASPYAYVWITSTSIGRSAFAIGSSSRGGSISNVTKW